MPHRSDWGNACGGGWKALRGSPQNKRVFSGCTQGKAPSFCSAWPYAKQALKEHRRSPMRARANLDRSFTEPVTFCRGKTFAHSANRTHTLYMYAHNSAGSVAPLRCVLTRTETGGRSNRPPEKCVPRKSRPPPCQRRQEAVSASCSPSYVCSRSSERLPGKHLQKHSYGDTL